VSASTFWFEHRSSSADHREAVIDARRCTLSLIFLITAIGASLVLSEAVGLSVDRQPRGMPVLVKPAVLVRGKLVGTGLKRTEQIFLQDRLLICPGA
jgi:hypothetical protein